MADEDADAPEGEEAPKGKSKKKLIIMVAAAVLLLGGGAAAYFLVFAPSPEAEMTTAQVEAEAQAEASEVAVGALAGFGYFSLPDMLVNLSNDGSRQVFLRMEATLELTSPSDIGDVKTRAKAIVDGFQTFLREMRPTDIAGSGGIVRLKEELLVRANDAIGRDVVRNVFLTEFLVQ